MLKSELKAKLSSDKAAAWELFNGMLERGQVDDYHLSSMLAHGGLTSQQQRECMAHAWSAGVEPGVFSYTALLCQLQVEGRSDEVEAALSEMRAQGIEPSELTHAVVSRSTAASNRRRSPRRGR